MFKYFTFPKIIISSLNRFGATSFAKLINVRPVVNLNNVPLRYK